MAEFNKMFLMLPVMLLARKLDGEDPTTLFWLRVAYAVVQSISVLIVLYTYVVASNIRSNEVVFVPQAATVSYQKKFSKTSDYEKMKTRKKTLLQPHQNQFAHVCVILNDFGKKNQPFSDPNAKKKYTETTFGAHCLTTSRNLVGSTVFGICITVGFHYYKGMVVGLAMQTAMAPFNLMDNPMVKALLWSTAKSIQLQDRIFGEKTANELTAEDEVVDAQGNPVVRRPAINNTASNTAGGKLVNNTKSDAKTPTSKLSLEEIMLDTWDEGAKADLSMLMGALTKENVNTTTASDKWTPLMILSGIGSETSKSAIRQVLALGADVTMTDVEGWNCLHWAGFHRSIIAAKELSTQSALLLVKDKEGHTPAETARKEGNNAVAEILEQALTESDTKKDK
jgi:Phosphate transport (Pho88)